MLFLFVATNCNVGIEPKKFTLYTIINLLISTALLQLSAVIKNNATVPITYYALIFPVRLIALLTIYVVAGAAVAEYKVTTIYL